LTVSREKCGNPDFRTEGEKKVSKVRRAGFDPRGSPGVRGNTRTTGGPLPYLSGGAPRRAGRPGIGFGPGRGVATSAGNKGFCSAPL
ncbi:hypothetical protein DVA76_18940, partial [Acinetobacter baumannii]